MFLDNDKHGINECAQSLEKFYETTGRGKQETSKTWVPCRCVEKTIFSGATNALKKPKCQNLFHNDTKPKLTRQPGWTDIQVFQNVSVLCSNFFWRLYLYIYSYITSQAKISFLLDVFLEILLILSTNWQQILVDIIDSRTLLSIDYCYFYVNEIVRAA